VPVPVCVPLVPAPPGVELELFGTENEERPPLCAPPSEFVPLAPAPALDPLAPDPVDPDPVEPDPVEPDPVEPDPLAPPPVCAEAVSAPAIKANADSREIMRCFMGHPCARLLAPMRRLFRRPRSVACD
jgi:hypothetical protein